MSVKAKTAVIGDVHGSLRELRLAVRFALANSDHIVFVGDYINRGPNSKLVVQELLTLRAQIGHRANFLRGNHEQAILDFLDSGDLPQP